MFALKSGVDVPDLTAWGSPETMGGTTLVGDVQISGLTLLGNGRSRQSAGWYGATKGRFRLVYPFQEYATLAEGSVSLTNEATGETIRFEPGDSWIIPKGTPMIWDVHSDRAVKHFMVSFDDL